MAPTHQRLLRLLLTVWFLTRACGAFQFKVGGSQGWTLPTDTNASIYNHWAEKNRFQIGDSLLFVYPPDHDSVLLVNKEDYTNCSTEKPQEKFTDGHTVYQFKQSGPHYFISGEAERCRKNEKLIVVVMADRSKHESNGTAESPPPSPTPTPSQEMSPPSPAPSGEESPSPPAEESNPSPAPSEESSPPSKNGAYSVAGGVVGTIAVVFASLAV